MAGKTKKISNKNKPLTLSKLRKALEHIKRSAQTKSVIEFKKDYKTAFGRVISTEQAEDYMKSLKNKQMKGGAAPLSYETRPGADLPYGNFPPYVSNGFGFANVASTLGEAAGVTDFPTPPAGLGSNKVGGSRKRSGKRVTARKQKGGATVLENVSAMFARPFPSAAPPSYLGDAQMLLKGANGFPSPLPTENPLHYPNPAFVHKMQVNPI